MKIANPTIGSDPEYGAVDQQGIPRSVVGFLPGTKQEPFPLNEHVSCQIDNVGAECCIPPCSTEDDFVKFMTIARVLTQQKLREQAPHLSLVSRSSQRYSDEELNSDSARLFGCDPSYCVYIGDRSHRPSPEQVGNLRSFGFHIHVGFKLEEGENQIPYVTNLIRAMDIMLGVPSIIIDRDTDRRQIYGNAGDLRYRMIKDILVIEYRTLGAFMHSSSELLRFCYQQTMKAIEMVNHWQNRYELEGQIIQSAIDTGNVEQCMAICNAYNIVIPEQFKQTEYATNSGIRVASEANV